MAWSGRALGLIETRGLIGAIEAGDAGVKSAPVELVKVEYAQAALVTVCFQGDVAAVKAAVDAGAAAAERVGELVSAHVIPRPHEDLDRIAGDGAAPVGGKAVAGSVSVAADSGNLMLMKVVELRRAARNVENFPLRGRMLARASRDEILDGFRKLSLL